MSPEQCRAARAWLNWSQQELAAKCQVSTGLLRDFEAGRRTPHPNNLRVIRQCLEDAGIEFLIMGLRQREAPKPKLTRKIARKRH